ncbi:Alanine--tRNA ligase [Candidatus Zixiibacteriota bacterium]|nr:Alanine--tRNA ligase [candidate division Zixibacteria bacterium]
MNQFKDIFTGKKKAEFKRVVTVQKCMRAGGKHNDLENVGRTGRHQTFFEMLGNFSFGDYFKEAAILYAWEWVNKTLQLRPDRLYATVYEDDDEAFALWEKIAPELKDGRVLRFGKKDNYWSMGDVGPNGPCSELHYDRGAQYSCGKETCFVNCDCDRYVEIGNLVFMQYNSKPDGTVEPLPKPSVDTGSGLERITAIIQGVNSNYETDLFTGIIAQVEEISKKKYDIGEPGVSHRVIADHLRALTFCIADGGGLSNEKQGYVLRRILRRAARHGRLLDVHEPFIYKLVPTLVGVMGDVYPEIKQRQEHIENVIRSEEESFGRTLDNGLELFDEVAKKTVGSGNKVIPGEQIFKLYDTFGFPVDLTAVMAEEKGLTLDMAGFEAAMALQQEKARAASQFDNAYGKEIAALQEILLKNETAANIATKFARDRFIITAKVAEALEIPGAQVNRLAIIPDQTPFYSEAGGQISDAGLIAGNLFKARVVSIFRFNDALVHICEVFEKGYNNIGQLKGTEAQFEIDSPRRWDIMRNHTATHLLHAALRKVLGEHVHQSGSYVGPDKLRFDFSHFKPMTPEELVRVEKIVNEEILTGGPVLTVEEDIEKAKKSGAMAIFGEKYGSRVRVVTVGDFSKELCGGTHVDLVSQIGPFLITLETGIASGIRRIEAITGRSAIVKMLEQKKSFDDIARLLNRTEGEIVGAIGDLNQKVLELQKENKKLKTEKFAGGAVSIGKEISIGAIKFRFHDFGEVDAEEMAGWVDSGKGAAGSLVTAALGKVDGKLTLMVSSSNGVKSHIGNISRDILKRFGGRGGGKDNFAQGTVPAECNSDEFFRAFGEKLRE